MTNTILSRSLVFLFVSLAAPAWGARVRSVEGRTVVVESEEPGIQVGEVYFTLNSEGKRKGAIEITEVSSRVVKARVRAGRPAPGQELLLRSPKKQTKAPRATPKRSWTEDLALHPRIGAGLAAFSLMGSGASGAKYDFGGALGAGLDMTFQSFGFEVGLLFYQAGWRVEEDSVKLTTTLNYLGFPLTLKYRWADDRQSETRLKLGLMPALLLSAKAKFEVLGVKVDQSLDVEDKTDYLAFTGVEYVETGSFFIDLSYFYGVKSYKNIDGTKVANTGFILSVGVPF